MLLYVFSSSKKTADCVIMPKAVLYKSIIIFSAVAAEVVENQSLVKALRCIVQLLFFFHLWQHVTWFFCIWPHNVEHIALQTRVWAQQPQIHPVFHAKAKCVGVRVIDCRPAVREQPCVDAPHTCFNLTAAAAGMSADLKWHQHQWITLRTLGCHSAPSAQLKGEAGFPYKRLVPPRCVWEIPIMSDAVRSSAFRISVGFFSLCIWS